MTENYLDDLTKEIPFEYCAMRFLRQWEQSEKELFDAVSNNPTGDSISDALKYFKVSRNFKDISKNPSLKISIKDDLISVLNDKSESGTVNKVNALTKKTQSLVKKANLSASTKLFWLSCRAPYIIYDSRAVRTLTKKAGHKGIANNYGKYVKAWRTEYDELSDQIEEAIEDLPNARLYMPKTKFTDRQLRSFSKKEWFKERVFDVFLWELGSADT
jgi:hypothetical protein